ncbi:Protein MSN5 [Colletotrichum sp. SAR11_59]|nr:Protein MSN5 [Colletotrichum sp. SAR11_59]
MAEPTSSVASTQTLTLDLPPSCIEWCPSHPTYLVVGTYNLIKDGPGYTALEDNGALTGKKLQNRSGSLIIFRLDNGAVHHVQTISHPSAILDLHFCPLSGAQDILAVVSSTGEVRVVRLDDAWQIIEGNVTTVMTHSLEAWTVAFCPPEPNESQLGVADGDAQSDPFIVYSGGDDSALRCASCADKKSGGEDSDAAVSLQYPPLNISGHGAGVTAILPIPVRLADGARIVVTGSYDDSMRILAIQPPHETYGLRKFQHLGEKNLGGGVWRLKLIDIREDAGHCRARILASCMHAGAKVVELKGPLHGGDWEIGVLARFDEHQSMNYGSDCVPVSEDGRLKFCLGAFEDALICPRRLPTLLSTTPAVMDGQAANGAAGLAQNSTSMNGANSDIISQIHQALEAIHNPYSSNDSRRDAQAFLENIKGIDEAPFHGFTLASDKSQSPVVRHYALSLLEHAIKHRWADYSEHQSSTLRGWMLELCRSLSKDDPLYIRNKTAQLWVEVGKRSWGAEWMDMDELLLRLWQIPDSAVHKELVLFVLETLSDEVFNGDDAVVAMREGVLSRSCVEIFTPATVLREAFPNRTAGPEVRYGEEVRSCAVKSLSVFHSLMPWAIPKAVAVANCVPVMCRALATPEVSIQKASLEALHTLYSRSNFTEQEFKDLVAPMYDASSVDLLKRLFEWSAVDVDDIDEDKYQFGKNPSLIIAIPVLATWTRLLNNRLIGQSPANTHLVGPLLEVCGSRLIRFENLPEDTQDPTFLFLMEDTDTVPERHAFLGNYRRFSTQVIETIVQLKLSDAVYHILGQAEQVLQHLYDGHPPMDVSKYIKHSMPVLRVDAQFTVIEAALKGYMKWRASATQQSMPDYEQQRAALERDLESWCSKLLEMNFEDPLIRKRVLQLLVAFSTTALDRNPGFMLKVLEHILMTWPAPRPEHRAFNEAIKDFQSESMVELQRLASKVPDHLLGVYDQIEAKVNDMISSGSLDEKRQIAYQSFLFIIIHRATNIDPSTQFERLQGFIKPVTSLWQNHELKSALSSYSGFCELMALDKAKRYLMSHRVHEVKDWGSSELDAEGLALQSDLEERQKMDAKINSEWEKLERQQAIDAAGDALTEEMKSESILRQVTYTAVIMVADFLDPTKRTDLEKLNDFVSKPASHTRQQRALVLDLLKDLKGISIAEQGKLPKTSSFGRVKRSNRSKMAQEFMTPANESATRSGAVTGARQGTPDGLEGVANLFEG